MLDTILSTFFWASAVAITVPLLLCGLGETIAERAGVFTVGLEGMMLAGAFSVVALQAVGFGSAGSVLAAGAVTCLLGFVYSLLVVFARADQVVVGIGFNLVILGLTSMFRRQWFPGGMPAANSAVAVPVEVPILSAIPWLGDVLFKQPMAVYVVYLLVPVVGFVLWRTRFGLVLRAVGDSANAAAANGLAVLPTRTIAMMINGFLAGCAGALLVLIEAGGVFVDDMTAGRGFLVLALVMFARWRPLWVMLGGVLFGAVDTLQYVGQGSFSSAVPPAAFLMAPFLLALIAWAVVGRSARGIGDLGKPYLV